MSVWYATTLGETCHRYFSCTVRTRGVLTSSAACKHDEASEAAKLPTARVRVGEELRRGGCPDPGTWALRDRTLASRTLDHRELNHRCPPATWTSAGGCQRIGCVQVHTYTPLMPPIDRRISERTTSEASLETRSLPSYHARSVAPCTKSAPFVFRARPPRECARPRAGQLVSGEVSCAVV
jgi:hypothetical protein